MCKQDRLLCSQVSFEHTTYVIDVHMYVVAGPLYLYDDCSSRCDGGPHFMASDLRRHWYLCNHVDYVSSLTTAIECCCSVAVSLAFFHLAALGILSIGLADALNCR